MRQRPGRTILTACSIVIGVAAAVAVTLISDTTRNAYDVMFATVRGKASLEVSSSANVLLSPDLLALVERVPNVSAAVPLVQRYSSLSVRGKRVRLQVLGIDPARDGAVRERDLAAGLELGTGDEILLEEHFAKQLDIKVGERVTLLGRQATRPRPFQVVGFVKMKGSSAIRQSGVAFMTLPRAQSLFIDRKSRKFDAIQIVTKPDAPLDPIKSKIGDLLPKGVEVHPPATDSNILQETLLSAHEGLLLATGLSLLLAAFLILNTFLMNVGERRRQFATLRAIGATRRQIAGMLLWESFFFGAIGTAIGIGAGIALAWTLNETLSSVLDVSLPPITPALKTAEPYAWAVFFGFFVSLVGALAPAFQAGRVSPLEGLSRVAPQDLRGVGPWRMGIGVVVIAVSSWYIYAGMAKIVETDIAILAATCLQIGLVMLLPLGLPPLGRLAVWCLQPFVAIEARMAEKQLLRHRSRSSLTIGVLFVAGSTGIGIAHSVIDNVNDVKDWYRQTVIGDFYVRALMPDFSTGLNADLPAELERDLHAIPGLANVDRVKLMTQQVRKSTTTSTATGTVGSASPATAATVASDSSAPVVAAPDDDIKVIAVVREYNEGGLLPFDLLEGRPKTLYDEMRAGGVVLGNILANKLSVQVGQTITMSTVDGDRQLTVAGITNDYMVGGLSVYMEWQAAEKLFEMPGADAYVIRAESGQLDGVRESLEQLTGRYGVILQSAADIRALIDRMILGIDGCLWGLIVLGFVVAAFGVVNTLSMSVLEQTRELGLLRVVAMTRIQVLRTILVQAAIIALVGLVPGIAAGNAIAYLINLATKPATGRDIAFGFHPELLFGTLLAALLVTLLGAYFPARRASNVQLATALHYE